MLRNCCRTIVHCQCSYIVGFSFNEANKVLSIHWSPSTAIDIITGLMIGDYCSYYDKYNYLYRCGAMLSGKAIFIDKNSPLNLKKSKRKEERSKKICGLQMYIYGFSFTAFQYSVTKSFSYGRYNHENESQTSVFLFIKIFPNSGVNKYRR